MAVTVDKVLAKKVLIKAYEEEPTSKITFETEINFVLNSNHKTYKYILINGLLAKATVNTVNPLALQAKSKLKGAYDARSLCHSVLVPFEREVLNNRLGGSNEPFLNKPARFEELSTSNAVRRGADAEVLLQLIRIFSGLKSSAEAYINLQYSLKLIKEIVPLEISLALDYEENYESIEIIKIKKFCKELVKKSFEGKTAVLVVGAIEKMYYEDISNKFSVFVHNVNQSGASSKEIGDIDIYYDSEALYLIEVKDKNFSAYDIEHVYQKAILKNIHRAYFIYNNVRNFDKEKVENFRSKLNTKNFNLTFIDIDSYVEFMLSRSIKITFPIFIRLIKETALEIKAMKNLIFYINSVSEITSKG
ncbi:restriction endonuclease, SacI family [Sphingobacterium sp. UBA6320]|uniref:restriction endonuclease, SacI family n=1 Tax=Sphingobacterium sp. UBA6320 TaxID=1947510 RepID=UPI0025FED5B8|nr:restriction endonuclease, SacI family [Sphingobacterium sp. UBA6320]